MLKIRNLALVAIAGMFCMQACNNDKIGEVQTTESGLEYKYLKKGEEQAPDSGKILALEMVYLTEDDSVLFDSREQGVPIGVPVNDPNMQGLLGEGFRMLHKGDSMEFIVPAKNFFAQTARMPVPTGIEEESNLIFRVGVQDVMDEEAYREMQMEEYRKQQEVTMKQQEEQLAKDVKTIEEYLAENNIDAQKSESGLYYTIQKEGSGPEVEVGDEVSVHYRGKLLDGTPFDSSYDRGEPFTLNVGEGMVIRGWDEGLQQLREGSEATFYIPSPLAYGGRAMGEVIDANSILVFDVEVVDVKE